MKRLQLIYGGNRESFRYHLKSTCHDRTTHVIVEPLDFITKLAALAPQLRVNLGRFHMAETDRSHPLRPGGRE